MKKRERVIFLALIFILSICFAEAQSAYPENSREALAREFNISLDKIPQNKSDIERFALRAEWERIISEGKVSGPIHRFFSNEKTQYFFLVLFAHKYEISGTFFLIVVLWAISWFVFSRMFESFMIEFAFDSERIKGPVSVLVGGLASCIVAQLQVYHKIISASLDLIFKQENWWMRTIISVILLGAVLLIVIISKMLNQKALKKEKAKRERELNQEIKEVKALNQGIREVSRSP